jgi:hypothetical protein
MGNGRVQKVTELTGHQVTCDMYPPPHMTYDMYPPPHRSLQATRSLSLSLSPSLSLARARALSLHDIFVSNMHM